MKILSGIFKVLSRLLYIVIAAALAIAVAPVLFGYHPTVILSGSMEPAYPVGGVIYYKTASFGDIKVGDAITFKIGTGAMATHRVVAKDEKKMTFNTKGDNNPSEDPNPVQYSNVVGKSSDFVIPYAGYVINKLKTAQAIVIMGVILLLGFIFVPDSKKGEMKNKKDRGEGGALPAAER